MDNRLKLLKIFKKISAIAFGVSFLMALVLFAKIGTQYISPIKAKYIFIGAGAVAFFFNLLSFESSKHNPIFSFIFWLGSIVVFVGLVFLIFRWPYSMIILIGGLVILGTSFFVNPTKGNAKKDSDLLDN